MASALNLVVFFLILHLVDCEHQETTDEQFENLWKDVVEKLGSLNSGIGPFENAIEEFSEGSKSIRREIFNKNKEAFVPSKSYDTKLNFFALLDKEERRRYLSAPNLNIHIIWMEILKLGIEPSTFAMNEEDKNDFSGVKVDSRHNGAYNSRGIMAAVMHMEYLYKFSAGIPSQQKTIFSSQYLLNCIQNPMSPEGPNWPYEVWRFMKEQPFVARESTKGMSWTGKKEQCTDVPPNAIAEGASVTSYHLRGLWRPQMEGMLDRGPLTVCIAVEDDDLNFFFYSSKPYTDLKMGGLFEVCNHFVLFVRYTQHHYVLQNTWGVDWGHHGKMNVARNTLPLDPMQAFLISYPVVKFDLDEQGNNLHLRSQFVEIWNKKVNYHYDDYFIPNKLEVGQIFEIRSNSSENIKDRYIRVNFLALTLTRDVIYGITVNFKEERVLQYCKPKFEDTPVKNNITKEMYPPDLNPEETVIRIRIDGDHYTALLNDETLTEFAHKGRYREINMIEVKSEGETDVFQLEEQLVPVGVLPNSGNGEIICRNQEFNADCEMWAKLGYCGDSFHSKFTNFMSENCPISCGKCW